MRKLPTLETRRLVLRPFLLSDAATVQRPGTPDRTSTAWPITRALSIPHPYVDCAWPASQMGYWILATPRGGAPLSRSA